MDGNRRPDIVIGGIWFRNDSGTWAEHAYAPEWLELDTTVETGDINGDGRVDIVITPSELKGERSRISWFESSEDVTKPWREHVIVPEIECVIHSLALEDFNMDGNLDVAWAEMHQREDPDEIVVKFNLETARTGRSW